MWECSPCYPTGREAQSRDDASLQLCAWRGSLEPPVMYTQLHSLLTFWSSYDFIILSTVWGHFQSLAYKLILFESMCIQSATSAHFQENMQFWWKGCMSLFPPFWKTDTFLGDSVGVLQFCLGGVGGWGCGVVITITMIIIPCQSCLTEEVKCTAV